MGRRGHQDLVPLMQALSAQGLNPGEISAKLSEMGHKVHRTTVMRRLSDAAVSTPEVVEGRKALRAMRVSRDTMGPAAEWLESLRGTLERLAKQGQEHDAIGLAANQTAGELALAAAELAADIVEMEAGAEQ